MGAVTVVEPEVAVLLMVVNKEYVPAAEVAQYIWYWLMLMPVPAFAPDQESVTLSPGLTLFLLTETAVGAEHAL